MQVGFDDLVDDVMSSAPETIGVFLAFRMGCVGCPIACFHTVDDACREHSVDRDAFLEALRSVVAKAIVLISGSLSPGTVSASTNNLCGSRSTIRCRAGRERLLLILHLGYAFVPFGSDIPASD